MKILIGEVLVATVGAFGVLCVKGIVKVLRFAGRAEEAWRWLRRTGDSR